MNIREQYDGDMTIDEARRSAAEEEMFSRVRREREINAAEEEEFEKAGKRIKEEKEKKDTERREKVRKLQKELNERVPSRTVPSPRGVVRPGEKPLEEKGKSADAKKPKIMSRRNFLKLGGAAVLGAGVARMAGLFSGKDAKEHVRLRESDIENEKWFPAYVRETGNVISFEKETILDAKVMNNLKDYWKDVYTGKEKKRDENGKEIQYDIAGAYEKIDAMKMEYNPEKYSLGVEGIKEIFREEGVPEDLCFLAIVESNGNKDAGERNNPARAGGLFQFMGLTAKWLGLVVDEKKGGRDDRFSVEKSARAAAKYLKWMMEGNGGNPFLALHEYNGSFALRYRLRKDKRGEKPSYNDFLKRMEQGINGRREEMIRYKGGEKAFQKDMREGWEGGVLGNYKENIEYTAKVRAVIELVNDPEWKWKNGVA